MSKGEALTTEIRWVEVPLESVLACSVQQYKIDGMTIVRHKAFVDPMKGAVVFKMTTEPAPPATADERPVCDCPSCLQPPRLIASSDGQQRYECEKCELATYDYQVSRSDAAHAWTKLVTENR